MYVLERFGRIHIKRGAELWVTGYGCFLSLLLVKLILLLKCENKYINHFLIRNFKEIKPIRKKIISKVCIQISSLSFLNS